MKIVLLISTLLISTASAMACPSNSRCLPGTPGAVAPRYEESNCTHKTSKYASINLRIDSSGTGYITVKNRDGEGETLDLVQANRLDYTMQVAGQNEEGTVLFILNAKSKMGTLITIDMYGRLKTVFGYRCQ